MEKIEEHLGGLCKPPHSLGRLETLAAALARVQDRLCPRTKPRRAVIFAADHGVVQSGASPWPQAVTGAILPVILNGKSAAGVLAHQAECDLHVVNVGTLAPSGLGQTERYRELRVGAGSADLAQGPALSVDEFEAALAIGREEARAASRAGAVVVVGGEMGIGNTTPAACLTALFTGLPASAVTGPGASGSQSVKDHKITLVAKALERERPKEGEPVRIEMVAALAGLEIAALAGFFLEAARQGQTIVLDGFITSAAALIAQWYDPEVTRVMIAAHRSAEPGHGAALDRLGLSPFLEWEMCLGEGTGALLLLPLMDAAAAIMSGMATLDDLTLKTDD